MTFALSVVNYACSHVHPPWHFVYMDMDMDMDMALEGGQSDVRMAHSLDCRHKIRGHRCEGRLRAAVCGALR